MKKNKFLKHLSRKEAGKSEGKIGDKRTDYVTMGDLLLKTGKPILVGDSMVGVCAPFVNEMFKDAQRRKAMKRGRK